MFGLLNSMADRWFGWQVGMLWQVGVLVGIVWIADAAIRRWAWPQVRYTLWMLVLLKLLIPPTLTSPASVTSQIPEAATKMVSVRFNPAPEPAAPVFSPEDLINRTDNVFNHQKVEESEKVVVDSSGIAAGDTPEMTVDGFPAEVPAAITPPGETGEVVGPILSWKVWAMFAWAAGVVVLSAWLVLRLSGLRKEHLKDNHAGQLPARFNDLLKAAAGKLCLKRLPRVIITERVSCPAVFGVFRPVLLMPVKFRTMDTRDTEHILLHELAHIKRGDLMVHAVYMILQIIYWFNPLLWMIRRTLQNLRELCCDATVARLLKEDTVHYRRTLLETARGLLAEPVNPGLGLLGLFENSNWLVTRLQWLEKKTWKNRPLRIATVMTLVSVMTVCVLPMANRPEKQPEEFRSLSLPYSVWMADIDGDDMKVLDLVSGEIVTLEAVRDESEFLQKIRSTSQGDIFATYKEDLKKPMVTFLRSAGLHGEPASTESIAMSPIPMEIPWETVITTQGGFKFKFRIVSADETACRIEYWPMNRKAKKAVREQFRVTGAVTDADTGQPIAGANVYDHAYNNGLFRTTTDAGGKFVLTTYNEEHTIGASADGYQIRIQTLTTWPFANHKDFNFVLTPLPAGMKTTVLLPEHFESKTVLSLKTGQFVAQQLADSANEPYLAYCYSAGRQPQKRTVYNVPEEEIIVIAGKMDTAGGGWGKDYEAAQGLWQAQSADQLPDFKTSHAYRIAIQEAMNGSDGLAIARPLDMDWPYITAFRGDDGTCGVFEIMSVQDRKIHVRFRTIEPVNSDRSPVASPLSPGVESANSELSKEFTLEQAQKAVAVFYAERFKNISKFTPLEWGELTAQEDGTKAIRCRHELSYLDKDQIDILDSMFFFDKTGQVTETLFLQPPTYRPAAETHSKGPIDIAPADFKLQLDEQRKTYSLIVSIRNQAEAVLPKHRIRFYRGNPAQGLDETGHPHTGWHEAGPIEPGKTWNESTYGLHLQDGDYAFSIVLDYDQAVKETNEDNNIASLQVTIKDGQIMEQTNAAEPAADKIELLKRMLDEAQLKYDAGMVGADEVSQAKINLLMSESEIADGPQKRAELLRQIAALYTEQVKLAEQQFAAGQIDQSKVHQLKLKALEAEQAVIKAEAQIAGGL